MNFYLVAGVGRKKIGVAKAARQTRIFSCFLA